MCSSKVYINPVPVRKRPLNQISRSVCKQYDRRHQVQLVQFLRRRLDLTTFNNCLLLICCIAVCMYIARAGMGQWVTGYKWVTLI